MNHSPPNGEAMPEVDTEIDREAEENPTFGEKIINGLERLSWDLTTASDEDLLSVAHAFADTVYNENALIEVSDFNGGMGIRRELQLALDFVRARPKRKECMCLGA